MRTEDSYPGLSYRQSGVDIDAGDAVVDRIKDVVETTYGPRVLRGLGHFGGFYQIGPASERATLVASIDGVGTKLKVAVLAGRHQHIGADIVNHCVNDILAGGARPLFFLDYFATGKLKPEVAVDVIGGIASACKDVGIALLGGETAEMPGVYSGDDYDLAGVVIGIVEQRDIVDGSAIRAGDVLIGIPSSGFHTNGYSLIRSALEIDSDDDGARRRLGEALPFDRSRDLADALLTPHRCYLTQVQPVLDPKLIHGMAHITGGGIAGNLGRVVPDSLSAVVDTCSWDVPPIFEYVAERGHISIDECYRVFNMGIGFILVCRAADADGVLARIEGSQVIGEVTTGDLPVELAGVEQH